MRRARRIFTVGFKTEAVKLATECLWGQSRLAQNSNVFGSLKNASLKTKPRAQKHTALGIEIKVIFDKSRDSAGKRTIKSSFALKGIRANLQLVRKLMIELDYSASNHRNGTIETKIRDKCLKII